MADKDRKTMASMFEENTALSALLLKTDEKVADMHERMDNMMDLLEKLVTKNDNLEQELVHMKRAAEKDNIAMTKELKVVKDVVATQAVKIDWMYSVLRGN